MGDLMSQHRRSSAIRRLFLSAAMIAAITLLVGIGTGWASGEAGSAPTIGSDKPDYAAGDLVVLTGENWQPGESVQIDVEDDEGKTWSREVWVTADERGQVRDEFTLPDWFVATYRVTATGELSGVATTTFTDGNVYVKNASTTPAGVTVGYRLERWNNTSDCPATAPSATANFTITGPEASSVSPAAGNSVGANNKDSVRVSFSSAPAGYAFEKWQSVAGAPSTNVGKDGTAPSTSTSFCINVSDSNISQTYVGFVKTTVTAPTAKAGTDQTVNEGSTVNLDGGGSTGATSYSWTQLTGPAVTLTGADTATPSFPAADGPATLTFRLTATNAAGSSTDDVQINVKNVKPTVILSGPAAAKEGESKTYTYTVTDPGADTPTVSEACGAAGTPSPDPDPNSYSCAFPDGPATSLVEVRADDGDEIGSGTLSVAIANVKPTVILSGPAAAKEGESKTYTYTVTDPGADTPTVSEACGAAGTPSPDPDPNSYSCAFPDGPATSLVEVRADDGDEIGSGTLSVAIANVAPSGDAGGPYSGTWGDPIEFSGTATDPAGSNDTLTFEWDFDYSGTFSVDTTGASPSHAYAAPGSYTAALRVSDEDGGADSIRTASVSVGRHPTTLTYGGDSFEQYSDFTDLQATLLDGSTPLAGETITFTIGSQTTTATTNASGVAATTLQITQANGSYTVKASYAGGGLYDPTGDSDPFTVTQENAGAFYTGALFAQTSSTTSSTATVALSATIKDITALTGDPAYDASAGEIPFAKVTFVDGGGKALAGCSNLPVGLVSLADPKVGTATCNWSANIGTQDSVQYTVGIKVEGRYIRYEATDDTVVTVSKPIGTNFITGGGYLVNQASAGQKAGGAGAKTNFGFNVKYNKSGTNLQGNINTIIRNAGRVYQIKGNSMTSLYVASSGVPSTTKPATATFNGKASIQDITDPLETKGIDGNATLQVTMTDKGEPGSYDTIGITVWNKAGGLWFASRWDSTRTVEQLLGGGNLVSR
jgi:PKD domain